VPIDRRYPSSRSTRRRSSGADASI
jgi:hypothetical protein